MPYPRSDTMAVMKTRIASALAVLAGVAVLSACSGSPSKTHSTGSGAPGPAVIQPVAAGQPTSGAGNAGLPASGSSSAASGNAAGSSSATSEDPDADLSAVNQDLSGIDSDLSQAAQSPSDGG